MADFIVIALIIVGLAGVMVYKRQLKKRGGSSCGCGCSGCPAAGACGKGKRFGNGT